MHEHSDLARLQEKVERLHALIETSAILNSSLDLDEVLRLVLEKAQSVANGGHVPFLWYHHGTGEAEVVDPEGGPPLGVLPEAAYSESTLRLGHGDSLILLTDGVLGCTNGAGESFDFPRLVKVVEEAGRTDTLLIRPIVRAVEAFTKDGQRHDDLTLVQATWR